MATQVLEQKLARHFELLDIDRDGYIERSDIKTFAERICKAAGVAASSPEGQRVAQQGEKLWQALQQSMDLDSDQQVSRSEFVEAADIDKVMRQAIQLGVAAFEVMDSDRDGRITRDEWTRTDEQLGVAVSDSRKGFGQLDQDNDGYVTKAEFTKGLEEFYRSADASAPGNWAFGKF